MCDMKLKEINVILIKYMTWNISKTPLLLTAEDLE